MMRMRVRAMALGSLATSLVKTHLVESNMRVSEGWTSALAILTWSITNSRRAVADDLAFRQIDNFLGNIRSMIGNSLQVARRRKQRQRRLDQHGLVLHQSN